MSILSDRLFSLKGKKVWVAGHNGMVGSALVRRLMAEDCEILTVERPILDLMDETKVLEWMTDARPDVIFVAAARVGGILANNSYPAFFLHENLVIQNNIIHSAHLTDVGKLIFLGSSCIYPRAATQPIPEEALLTGPLEATNEWYAVAKIAGIKMCQAYRAQYSHDFISAMPTNLYGEKDNYDLETSHVAAALMVKMHRAKVEKQKNVEIWGTGTPLREFLHVDDLADALVFLAENYSDDMHINVGSGMEISILELAELLAEIVSFRGEYTFDRSKPDGTPRKLMDSSKLKRLGWAPKLTLREGMAQAYDAYQQLPAVANGAMQHSSTKTME